MTGIKLTVPPFPFSCLALLYSTRSNHNFEDGSKSMLKENKQCKNFGLTIIRLHMN